MIVLLVVAATPQVASRVAPYGCSTQPLRLRLHGPSAAHLLGTDATGRAVLSRLIYGRV